MTALPPADTAAHALGADQLARARAFVAGSGWCFARTMPTIPHEYTVRDLVRPHRSTCASAAEFEWFVALVREHGTTRTWGRDRREFTYLVVDDHEYWTMGAPVEETTVLNRQVVG